MMFGKECILPTDLLTGFAEVNKMLITSTASFVDNLSNHIVWLKQKCLQQATNRNRNIEILFYPIRIKVISPKLQSFGVGPF